MDENVAVGTRRRSVSPQVAGYKVHVTGLRSQVTGLIAHD
jgi:hypothetical protein